MKVVKYCLPYLCLLVVCVLLELSLTSACGGGSKKCSWQTCTSSWGAWSPNPCQGCCRNQVRRANHRYQTHEKNGGCPGSTRCTTSDQQRHVCSCRRVYSCSWGGWSSWSGSISRGTCGQQRRYRNNKQSVDYTIQVGSCSGVNTKCDGGSSQTQSRTMCSCRQAINCKEDTWTSWSPSVSNGICRLQTRTQDYIPTYNYVNRLSNCNTITSSCQSAKKDSRKHCMCPYKECTLNDWSEWKVIVDRPGCPMEERFRHWTGVTRYKGSSNCNTVTPNSCQSSQREERGKDVKCPAIHPIAHAKFIGEGCNGVKSKCKSVCQIDCTTKGYHVEGNRFVTCNNDGKWDRSIGYCKDTEEPDITCPVVKAFPNDANKNFATVQLPEATAKDNSGLPPNIVVSKTSPSKVMVGKPVVVKYTAKDKAGNEKYCTITLEAKDTESPKATFCPKDITVVVETIPHSVVWTEPEFRDNVDTPVPRVPSHSNGQLFSRGRHLVRYIARDKALNNATCEFFVQVSPIKCPIYDPPKHGALSCNIKKGGYKERYVCSPSCQSGYWFLNGTKDPTVYDYYICHEDGTWRGQDEYDVNKGNLGIFTNIIPKDQVPWPSCAAGTPPEGYAKSYKVIAGTCKDKATQEKIKKELSEKLRNDVLIQSLFCNVAQGHCEVENIEVTCAKRRKRGVVINEMEIHVKLRVDDPTPVQDQQAEIDRLKKIKDKVNAVNAKIKDVISKTVQSSLSNVHESGESFGCKSGKAFAVVAGKESAEQRSKCIRCPTGMYYDSSARECLVCPVGTYQDKDNKLSCIKCPDGYSTHGFHANNYTECKEICKPGTYSINGLATCLACPKGTYQAKSNSTQCINCPQGKGTNEEGASSETDCTRIALHVSVRSEGCDDPNIKPCGHATINVNGVNQSLRRRGYNIVVVDAKTGNIDAAKAYDTHCCQSQSSSMVSYINSIPNGKIVLVAIQDEGTWQQVNGVFAALASIGGKEPFQREYRASFALAGYKGSQKVTWIKQVSKPRRQGPSILELNIPLQ